MIFEVEVGDRGGDGHEKYTTFMYKTNATTQQLNAAYKKGVEKLGFDITKYCSDYEENKIPLEIYNKVVDQVALDPPYGDEKESWIGPSEFCSIWLHTIVIGDDTIVIEEINPDASFDIGGYGLFY